jgi:hypothetical protein
MKKGKLKTKGMSKRKENFNKLVNSLPSIEGITGKSMLKINEAFECYKKLLNRYSELRNDPKALNRFYSMCRNPLFDITGISYFRTGLMSNAAAKCQEKCYTSQDHFIQRTKALKYIFRDMAKNPNMTLEQFIALVKKYCSTVTLTKEEHRSVTTYGRKHKDMTNVKIYKKLGIKVTGLGQWCKENYVTKAVEMSY